MISTRFTTPRNYGLLALTLVLISAFAGLTSSQSAQANTVRNIAIDCVNSQLDGTIYLFPGETLSINLSNCTDPQDRPQLYTDDSGDPVYLNTSVVEMTSSSGSFLLNAEGTFSAIDGIFTGQTSGHWLPNRDGLAYTHLGVSYLEVKLAQQDMTSISGMSLLDSPQITIPATVPSDQTAIDVLTGQNSVFSTHTFHVHKIGDYFLREMRTTPDTFFTDDAARIGTWAQAINPIWHDVALYSNFDKTDTERNKIDLAEAGLFEGNYTSDGTVFGKFSRSMSVHLEPGTYTLVMLVHFPIEMWNATDGSRPWGAAIDQGANFQIWGPEGGLTAPATLASTGQHLSPEFLGISVVTLGIGLAILRVRRRRAIQK